MAGKEDALRAGYWDLFYQLLLACRTEADGYDLAIVPEVDGPGSFNIRITQAGAVLGHFVLERDNVRCEICDGGGGLSAPVNFDDLEKLQEIVKLIFRR